jgi:hypothetical protein
LGLTAYKTSDFFSILKVTVSYSSVPQPAMHGFEYNFSNNSGVIPPKPRWFAHPLLQHVCELKPLRSGHPHPQVHFDHCHCDWPNGNAPSSQLTEHRGIASSACPHVALWGIYQSAVIHSFHSLTAVLQTTQVQRLTYNPASHHVNHSAITLYHVFISTDHVSVVSLAGERTRTPLTQALPIHEVSVSTEYVPFILYQRGGLSEKGGTVCWSALDRVLCGRTDKGKVTQVKTYLNQSLVTEVCKGTITIMKHIL